MSRTIIPLIFITLLTSCGSGESTQKEPTKEETTTQQKSNDDNRLIANPETAEGMLMMQHLIESFKETKEENKNYAVLLGELSYQCDYIIKNCSMKGADHDKLHTILHPILDAVEEGKQADSNEKINAALETILSQTKRFFETFKTATPA